MASCRWVPPCSPQGQSPLSGEVTYHSLEHMLDRTITCNSMAAIKAPPMKHRQLLPNDSDLPAIRLN